MNKQVAWQDNEDNKETLAGKFQTKPANLAAFNLGFLEYLSDGIVVLDRHQQIVAVNRAITRILGWSNAELVGRAWQVFLTEPVPVLTPFESGFNATTAENGVSQVELSLICKNAEKREFNARFSAFHISTLDGLPDGLKIAYEESATSPYGLVILRDITEQKRLERIKTQFVVTASHHLRTPLAPIKTSIGLVLDNLPPDLTAPVLLLLKNIESSTLRMERLVNDLIELANLHSGLVELRGQILEVNSLVMLAVTAGEERLQKKGQPLELRLPAQPLFVKGDRNRLLQILGQLLSNASKFSQPGTSIRVTVSLMAQPDGEQVVFSVVDEGSGIRPEEGQLIFEKFYQSEISENADGSGSGLGLSLAKALAELHGGQLWFESTPGMGSTFYFGLPVVKIDPPNK